MFRRAGGRFEEASRLVLTLRLAASFRDAPGLAAQPSRRVEVAIDESLLAESPIANIRNR